MDTLFSSITAVTMVDKLPVIPGAYVGVTDGKISYISTKPPKEEARRVIDGRGMVLMPGLINCHTHIPMTPLRGYGDDHSLSDWLNNYIFPKEDLWDSRAIRAATLLGIAECLRFGTTSISDMYYFSDDICQCVAETGIKGNIARCITVFDEDYCFDKHVPSQELVALHQKWHGYDHDRIRVEASIHAEYTSFDKVWHALAEYAINNDLGMQVHVSETKSEHDSCLEKYGMTPAQLLDVYHVWDARAVAAHCVWLDDEDISLFARRGVTAVHCPNSNLKLASGIAPVRKLLDGGMNVALGTDGVSSSNNTDMFEAIKLAALLSNGSTLDPTSLSAQEALKLATVNGAKAQGRETECGMLAPGMDADLIMLDFTQPHLIPCHNPISNLCYAASGHDVRMTMVRGKVLYEDGNYPTIDLQGVLQEFHDYVIPLMFGGDGKEQPNG
jgi:5-methylthioadenosine/S-adenosylhomocysteine deaminase